MKNKGKQAVFSDEFVQNEKIEIIIKDQNVPFAAWSRNMSINISKALV